MLGKTANGLFWMSRYLERAENTARLIETGQRIALTRLSAGDEEWRPVLQSAGVLRGYLDKHDKMTSDTAIDWLLRDLDNPSSVRACIEAARQNARLVRTAITGDVWEATNSAYMSASRDLRHKVGERDLPGVLRQLRGGAALVRGATLGTMLRNEIYDFARLGTFIERADNTARILDVKYYVLLPSPSAVGTSLDNVQWESILRSLSARGGIRMEYGNAVGPREIVDFLILDERMPRSLKFCANKIVEYTDYLTQGRTDTCPSDEMARDLRDVTLAKDVTAIFDGGLHEFLQGIQSRMVALTRQVEIDFRFYE